jgi:trehalose/maltose transport system substrate-binding protein
MGLKKEGEKVRHRTARRAAGVAGILAFVVSLSVVAAGSAGTSAQEQNVRPPKVANAAAIKQRLGGKSITFIGDNIGKTHQRDVMLARRFTRDTGIRVKVIAHPAASTESFSQLARLFSSKSSSADVVMLDVVWPGAFAPFLVDLKRPLAKEARLHERGIVQNGTVKGKLIAMPFFSDYGILYYRTDLLRKYGYQSPPRTWQQLGQMARRIQAGERDANPDFAGFVFQGNAYEGLTCDALEWIASSGGGTFIENGRATIDNPRAASILNLVRSWVGNIAPRGVTSYQETEAHTAFATGNAAFMRNWPYAYAVSQDGEVKGKFDVTVLPHTGNNPSVGTIGGWMLGVSRFSKNIPAAIEFVRYMTSPGAQKFNAIFATNPPTIPSVGRDPAVRRVNPWLKPEIANVRRVGRPSGQLGAKYQQGSQAIYQGVNQILNGQDAKNVLPRIESQLNRLLGR